MLEFGQFLVLVFTVLVWWLAKRDLTARASRLRAASSAEVDELKETVEALTAALEQRVTAEEKRLSALIAEARALQSPLVTTAVAQEAPVAEKVVAEPAAPPAAAPIEVVEEPAPPVAIVVTEAPKEAVVDPIPVAAVADEPEAVEEVSEETDPKDLLAVSEAPRVEPKPEAATPLHEQVMEAERRAALVRAQLAIGITDAVEITRRTGLPRGEVELLIGLRSLRIEPVASVEATVEKITPSAAAPSVAAAAPSAENDRYAAIYAMLASGVTDSTEIARRTGMGRGEIELILGLRARNVL